MATRSRRVEYVFDQRTTTLATATRLDLAAETITIAETASRTFKSVLIDVRAEDNNATPAQITACLVGIKLGATAFDDVTFAIGNGNTGDGYGMQYTRDVTSYANTNFGSGSTQTCQVGVKFTGSGTINITVKITFCYEFDDSSATTRTKTVKIPLESALGALTTSLVEIGTNQVPNLDSFLPEASKTYKSVWFEVLSNAGAASTTDSTLSFALDSESAVGMGLSEMGGGDGRWMRHLWRRNDMTTNAAHAFKAKVSNVSTPYRCLSVLLCVTYTYDHSASTSILQSLEIAAGTNGMIGWYTSGDATKVATPVYVEEPGTITLKQSGVLATFTAINPPTDANFACGSQTARAFTPSNGGNSNSPMGFIQRVDSGSTSGAGMTLARGKNTLTTTFYCTGQYDAPPGTYGATLYLNYTSDKHSEGDGAHAHTIVQHVSSWDAGNVIADLSSWTVAPSIPETQYALINVGLYCNLQQASSPMGADIEVTTTTSDPVGLAGVRPILNTTSYCEYSDIEQIVTLDITRHWLTHPGKLLQTDRLDLEVSRAWRMWMAGAIGGSASMYLLITYHAVRFTVSGTISAYGGAGTGIPVVAINATTHEAIATANTTSGGAYTITVYDDTEGVYTVAREDDTHTGRSANVTPTAV